MERLTDDRAITEITGRKGDRIWVAPDALGVLKELDRRIRVAMTPQT